MSNPITGRPDADPFCLPCVNCASEICCPPPAAHRERVSILCALGMDEDMAHKASGLMVEKGIVFFPASIAQALAEFVDHPGRHPLAKTADVTLEG